MASRMCVLIMIVVPAMLVFSGCEQFKDYRKKVYYEKGFNLYEKQQYQDALRQASQALEFDDEYLDGILLRAMCMYELKDYKAAALAYEAAVILDETRDDILLKSAEAFYMASDWGRAKIKTDVLLEKNPDNAAARYIDARNRLRSRYLPFWRDVDTILQPLLDDAEYGDRAFALLAEFNILNDDLHQARLLLLEHADVNDEWLFSMRMLASRYESAGNQEAVLRLYRRLLELKPDSNQDIEQLRSLMRKFGRKDEEFQLIQSLIAGDAQQIRYKLILIDYYIYYGQFAEAEECTRAGIESGTGYVDFSRRLIKVYERTNRIAAAIQVAKDVLGQLEETAYELKLEFMTILAWLYYEDNNVEMARFVVRWILEVDRDWRDARFLLARIALDEGRSLLAISELRGLASEDADNPDYDFYMGLAHLERSEVSNAEQSFKQVLKKDPTHKQALLKLSEIYLEKGFFRDVEEMVNGFLASSPNDPDMLALQAELAGKLAGFPEDG